MALLEYFKRRAKTESSAPVFLPDENGPLSKEVPSSSIREANVEVSKHFKREGSVSHIYRYQTIRRQL